MTINKRNARSHKPIWEAVKKSGSAEVRAHREIHKYLRSRIALEKVRDVPFRLADTERNAGSKLQFTSILHPDDPAQDVLKVVLTFKRVGAL